MSKLLRRLTGIYKSQWEHRVSSCSIDQWRPEHSARLIMVVLILTIGALAPTETSAIMKRNTPTRESEPVNEKKTVAAWLPYWDIQAGMDTLNQFSNSITEVSPFWYTLSSEGDISSSPGAENQAVLDKFEALGKPIFPTISSPDSDVASAVLNDPAQRHGHINKLTRKTVALGYDGIDIDYENLPAADRDVFSLFIRELADSLHSKGKILIVTVNSKTEEPGGWNGPQSHDYSAIAAAADKVRIMAYDQHYVQGEPGPIASKNWVERVITFALTKIPREKLILGLPAYGYDWTGGARAKSLVFKDVPKDRSQGWDDVSSSPFMTYFDGTVNHEVWFENARSLEAKVELVNEYKLAGVAIWRLGREDPQIFPMLEKNLLSGL
ncbi:MAG TPA: hypothetical protein ENI11_01915 [Actinobacteria bacterium]|nr:hypothetical protein [Actinomycetota bacterium]